MKKYYLKNLKNSQLKNLIKRKNISSDIIKKDVNKIISDIKLNGLRSALKYAQKFDNYKSANFFVTKSEFKEAEKNLNQQLKSSIRQAYKNIYAFHQKQIPKNYKIETESGVLCERKFVPIENVGLYVPSGTAPLPSTMLMLGIPAQIAGCKRVVVATPSSDKVHPAILYSAKLCGISEIIKIGGAQGIALLAYGDSKFNKVDKIFGPGNQFVTTAKSLISIDPEGCSIDMIAGPSEVMVIADESANPEFVAADMLSQAEHGKDSIAVLVSTSDKLVSAVKNEIKNQIEKLPRKSIAKTSIKNSFSLVVENLDQAFDFSNKFAPEHLILNTKNANGKKNVINAGSVFIGPYSPESAGDYVSGTNHSLPTYGFARSIGGVGVEMFFKSITFQKITKSGLKNLADSIITLAKAESLEAHANAVKVRLK